MVIACLAHCLAPVNMINRVHMMNGDRLSHQKEIEIVFVYQIGMKSSSTAVLIPLNMTLNSLRLNLDHLRVFKLIIYQAHDEVHDDRALCGWVVRLGRS